jgi:hypothetical protein
MKKGQLVTSSLFIGEGKIVADHGAEFLVEHEINTDGRPRKIQQWYDFSILTGVPTEEEVADKKIVLSDVSEATKVNGDIIGEALKSVELGVDTPKEFKFDNGSVIIPIKSRNTTRGNRVRAKVELGVTPENEESKEDK